MPIKRNGSWYTNIRWRIGERTGRVRRKIGARRTDALAAEARIRAALVEGTFVPDEEREYVEPQTMPFATFAEESFLPWSGAEHSSEHHRRVVRIVKKHLIPYFEGQALHEITRAQIEQYKTLRRESRYRMDHWKRSKPVQAATVNRELACIKFIFRLATEWSHLEQSPAAGVSQYKEPPNPPQLLEREQIAALLETVPHHHKALVGMAVYAGLRRSELFHLEWRDIDVRNGVVTVAPQGMQRSTKNNKVRRIPINVELAQLLDKHPRRLDSRLVFANKDGLPFNNVRKALLTAGREIGVEGVLTLHQLRHAFCSHALMAGIDARTVQSWMGHGDLKVTLRYAHISPEHEQRVMQQLSFQQGVG
jgi:integrase